MLRLLSDENFNGEIVLALLRRLPELDLVRVQDVGLQQAEDPTILEWAADQQRVVLTHDPATMPACAYERLDSGEEMTGLVVVDDRAAIGRVIADLLLLVECSHDREWDSTVLFLPWPD